MLNGRDRVLNPGPLSRRPDKSTTTPRSDTVDLQACIYSRSLTCCDSFLIIGLKFWWIVWLTLNFHQNPFKLSVHAKIESDLEWAGTLEKFKFLFLLLRCTFLPFKKRLLCLILTKKTFQSENYLKFCADFWILEGKEASNPSWTQSAAIFHSLVARQSSWSDASQFSLTFDKFNHKQINSFIDGGKKFKFFK